MKPLFLLKSFVAYAAKASQLPIIDTIPRNTSLSCMECGSVFRFTTREGNRRAELNSTIGDLEEYNKMVRETVTKDAPVWCACCGGCNLTIYLQSEQAHCVIDSIAMWELPEEVQKYERYANILGNDRIPRLWNGNSD